MWVVPGDYKVIAITHATDCLDDLIFIVGDDFDPLEVLICGVYSELWIFVGHWSGWLELTMPKLKHHFAI